MVSMNRPSYYDWPEYDPETDELRPGTDPSIVKAYNREKESWQKAQREAWGQMILDELRALREEMNGVGEVMNDMGEVMRTGFDSIERRFSDGVEGTLSKIDQMVVEVKKHREDMATRLNIGLTLKKAKLSHAAVSIKTDDGEVLHGTVEELNEHTLKLRQKNGVMFVPVDEIVAVSYE